MTVSVRGGAGTPVGMRDIDLFAGPGEMPARCRAFDWSATPLGPASTWSQSLRTTVPTMLASRHPMFLWWGSELVQIFNDGYLPSFGTTGRDATALGAPGREHWAEIWHLIGPEIEAIMGGGDATWHEDHLVPIERNGHVEDVWWTYGYSPVRDDDGAVGGVLVIVQETTTRVLAFTERERLLSAERAARAEADTAREELARVFAQAPVAIAVLRGRELRYAFANATYQQIVGNRDPTGKRLIEMFSDLAGSEIEGVLERVYDSGVPFVATNLCLRFDSQGDGEIDNYYDLVYHPLVGSSGAVNSIVVVAVEVTARRDIILEGERLLAMAELARTEAESANRAKSDFLAIMSHELRTPLNAICGHAELMELGIHGPVTPEQTTALARIQQSQRHLLSLIDGVLNYSRVEAGAVQYAIDDVPLDDVLATCQGLVAPQARAKGIALTVDGCAPTLAVRADREKVQQIVLNLLSNALKFTDTAGAVTIACNAAGSLVCIRVTDSGRGISADQLERIFLPFVQVDVSLTRTQDGPGLGLAISRDLARAMGGDLMVESTLGVGSTFTLTLPVA